MNLLEIRNLSVDLPLEGTAIHALRRVNLLIQRGTIHGLIGESGCGKTMTAMSLLGLLPRGARIMAEQFVFDGMALSDVAGSLRGRRIALISQDPAAALNPVLTIRRQMDDVLRAHHALPRPARHAQAVEFLAATGLADPERVLRSYPHQLSGGMQQRVVIAQALATGADLLIADEPTTALDVTVGAQVLALLRQLVTERGLTILMITHDMDVVAEVCDSATVLYAGTSVEGGATAELLANPRHPYTRALLAALPDAAPRGGRLAAIEGRIPSPVETITGCIFAPRCMLARSGCTLTSPPTHLAGLQSWDCVIGEEADVDA
ncbi:MAG: ABC transporter ATP-binding protein [Cypionkella sp.]|uniref:ABC transporter ATP-binding protein n=1 Tax=Cypionkella sp. TaxID=2811411 RepID=UPI002ABC94DF|nr:ABC transporter ATP-binding protein [Cypionkella sp.]MDZ4312816.1 ABC transporter ATP-binding protein [Cypionkella sp.]